MLWVCVLASLGAEAEESQVQSSLGLFSVVVKHHEHKQVGEERVCYKSL